MKENYGFEKLYSQGLSIRTPLDINYQLEAIKALRKGIQDYDKRHGWRGPITNKLKDKNWENKIKNYKLDPTLNWNFAEITFFDDKSIRFKILNDKKRSDGVLNFKSIKWTLKKIKPYQKHLKLVI